MAVDSMNCTKPENKTAITNNGQKVSGDGADDDDDDDDELMLNVLRCHLTY